MGINKMFAIVKVSSKQSIILFMSTEKIKRLTNSLSLSFRADHRRSPSNAKDSPSISFREMNEARRKYIEFSNHSKEEQKQLVRLNITARRPGWKQDCYRANNIFSSFPKQELEKFPHNNDKYNVQFLDRSLRGRSLKLPSKDLGYFQNPQDSLLSEHYKPIVNSKRSYNQTYELRTSLYGETWVDEKRNRIMDKYVLQANPFSTPLSNTLISTMRRERMRHKL